MNTKADMTRFKDALEETMQGGLHIHLKYDQDSGQSMMRPVEPEHINTIRLALRIAHEIQAEPMSKEMYIAGEKAQTEGFVIQNPARIFQAMIEQMMSEVQDV